MLQFFSQWTQEELHRRIAFVQGGVLLQEMQNTTDIGNAAALRVNSEYSIYKTVGGVRIESGALSLRPVLLKEILALTNDFLLKKNHIEPRQNINALMHWADFFGWPKPDMGKCEGYILNCEMVRFSSDSKGSTLLFKYKDSEADTFCLYSLYYLLADRSYFFLIKRSF